MKTVATGKGNTRATTTAKATAVVSDASKFVNSFLTIVEGADALSDAQELQEHATSIIETQILIKKGTKHEKKRAVTSAVKAFEVAKVNGGKVIEGSNADLNYLTTLISAKTNITTAQNELLKVDEDIALLEALLKEIKE